MKYYLRKFYIQKLALNATDEELEPYEKILKQVYEEAVCGKRSSVTCQMVLHSTGLLRLMNQKNVKLKMYRKNLRLQGRLQYIISKELISGIKDIVMRSTRRLR